MDTTFDAISVCSDETSALCLRCVSNRIAWDTLFALESCQQAVVCPPAIFSAVLVVAHSWSFLNDWRLNFKRYILPSVTEESKLIECLEVLEAVYQNKAVKTDARLLTWKANNKFSKAIASQFLKTLGCAYSSSAPVQLTLDDTNKAACSKTKADGLRCWINEATQSSVGNATEIKLALHNSIYTAALFAGSLKGNYGIDSSRLSFIDMDGKEHYVKYIRASSNEVILEQFFVNASLNEYQKWKASMIRTTLPLSDNSKLVFVTTESDYLTPAHICSVLKECAMEAFLMTETQRLHNNQTIEVFIPEINVTTSVDALAIFGSNVAETFVCSAASVNVAEFKSQLQDASLVQCRYKVGHPFLFAVVSEANALLLAGYYFYPPARQQ